MAASHAVISEHRGKRRAPAYRDEFVTVYQADCLELLPTLPAGSVAAVVTDPPYGLAFMGRDWDQPWAVLPTGFADRSDLRLPRYRDQRNATCRICGGRQRGERRYDCASPQRDRSPLTDSAAYQRWCERWAQECWRVLKPGGHLVAFGGTRTWHRLATGIEDAGFEIRDTIAWLYGQGFPKSLDVSKVIDRVAGAERTVVSRGQPVKRMIPGADQNRTGSWRRDSGRVFVPTKTVAATTEARQWQGWGTGLKPAFEPIVIARKPLAGTVAKNVLDYGTGALHINVCRVPAHARPAMARQGEAHVAPMVYGRKPGSARQDGTTDLGRWPSNVVLSHAYGCAKRCAPTCPVAGLDAQSGRLRSGANPLHRRADIFRDCYGRFAGQPDCQPHRGADGGGASRFFPAFRWQAKAPARERPRVEDMAHPTVKPLELMRWLVRLVTPPGGVVLDPFLGSGTTAEAARAEGFQCLGIERESDYVPLIRARLNRSAGDDVKHRSDPGAKHGTAGASPLDSDRGPPK